MSSNEITFFALSVLLFATAQILRIFRFKAMLYSERTIKIKDISRSIATSYTANIILPFKLGELFRINYLRKKGYGLFATGFAVVNERMFDALFLSIIWGAFLFSQGSMYKEFLVTSSLIGLLAIGIILVLQKPLSIRNRFLNLLSNESQIQLHLLAIRIGVNSKKVITNIRPILIYSLLINSLISLSVILLSYVIDVPQASLANTMIFDLTNSLVRTLSEIGISGQQNYYLTAIFLFIPFLLLFTSSRGEMTTSSASDKNIETMRNKLIPQLRSQQGDQFIRDVVANFSSKSKDLFTTLNNEILNDAKLIDVLQGGSGDFVFLVQSKGSLVVRKVAFGSRQELIIKQYRWLERNRKNCFINPLQQRNASNAAYFDMEYLGSNSDFFTFLHTKEVKYSQELLSGLLDSLLVETKDVFILDGSRQRTYLDAYRDKVDTSFTTINNLKLASFLECSATLGGRPLVPINKLLLTRFLEDNVLPFPQAWTTHGDLTVANLLVADEVYIKAIDPNPNQAINHPSIDLGKLMQSFRCGYEFDFKKPKIIENLNEVTVFKSKSYIYFEMERFVENWIDSKFDEEMKYHTRLQLLLHLLRIMPYTKTREQAIWTILNLRACFEDLLHSRPYK